MTNRLPTIGGLRIHEMTVVAKLLNDGKEWTEIKTLVFTDGTLAANRSSTSKRYFGYIKALLSELSNEEIAFLAKSSYEDQKGMIWIGYCRLFALVGTFVTDYICTRVLSGETTLPLSMFRSFVSKMVDTYVIEEPSEATFSKARAVIFSTLRELGILEKDTIQGVVLSPSIIKRISRT
jgi:hypothetical protein